MELFKGALEVEIILAKWYQEIARQNFGAFIPFIGIVREEGGIEALSFDIYEPILLSWFNSWMKVAKKEGALIKMAHSIGDVPIHTSSFIGAVASPKRKVALRLINEFVEDFKANAPIWKYDVINGQRIYAKNRSTPMMGAGILGEIK